MAQGSDPREGDPSAPSVVELLHHLRPRDPWHTCKPPRLVRCVAHPYRSLAHVDEPCRCFAGGPPPMFV